VTPDRRPTAAELMTGKAKPRQAPAAAPAKPAPRIRSDETIGRQKDIGSLVKPAKVKPVRITLDLDQATYKELNQWLGSAAAEVGAPVSKARALRAMIRAVSLDKSIGFVVIDLLRREH
jgi:hypothetical protein